MKKYSLLIIILLLVQTRIYSQILVVKTSLGSCPKCKLPISLLSNEENKIPTYLVFPEDLESDAKELAGIYGLKDKGIIPLFNDRLTDNLLQGKYMVYLLSPSGAIIWTHPLMDLNAKIIEEGNNLYRKLYSFKQRTSEINLIKYNARFALDYVLGRISVFTQRDTIIYRMQENEEALAMKKAGLIKEELTDEAKAFFALNKQYRPTFTFFYPHSQKEISIMGQYYLAIRDGENTTIAPQNVLFRYDSKKLQETYPISLKNLPPVYSFDASSMILPDDTTLLLPFFTETQLPFKGPGRFIGVFKLHKGRFEYERQLNLELPDVYKNNLGTNIVSFQKCSYPYLVLPFGKEIYNLKTGKMSHMPFPKLVDYGTINAQDLLDKGDQIIPFKNVAIAYNKENHYIYLINKYKGEYFLQIINEADGDSVKVVKLNKFIPSIDRSSYIAIELNNEEAIYTVNEENLIYGYPMSILN